jgi:hypothetical protein
MMLYYSCSYFFLASGDVESVNVSSSWELLCHFIYPLGIERNMPPKLHNRSGDECLGRRMATLLAAPEVSAGCAMTNRCAQSSATASFRCCSRRNKWSAARPDSAPRTPVARIVVLLQIALNSAEHFRIVIIHGQYDWLLHSQVRSYCCCALATVRHSS